MASGNAPNEQGAAGNRTPDLNFTCILDISDRLVITAVHVPRYNLSLQYFDV
jgi:hypothetical protein